jgi:hypothetical protein
MQGQQHPWGQVQQAPAELLATLMKVKTYVTIQLMILFVPRAALLNTKQSPTQSSPGPLNPPKSSQREA